MKPFTTISIAELLASISDPSRLRMLRLLEKHELAVGEVAKIFQIPQSTASRQLKVLADSGWLIRRNEGTTTYYQLRLDDLLEPTRRLWAATRPALGDDGETAEDDRRVAGVMAERRTDSLGFFGRVKGEWDHVRAELFGGRFTSAALLALIHPDWVIADVGCGTGNVAELLSPVVERVIAIDQSEPMLAAARERLAGKQNVSFVAATLDRLPLESQSADAAVCMLVLHHIEDPASALKELRRVLRGSRGGGVLAIVDMVQHDREDYRHSMGHRHLGFSRATMEAYFEQAGFRSIFYHELPADPDAKGPALFVATGRV